VGDDLLVFILNFWVTLKDRLEAVELHLGFQSEKSGSALTLHNSKRTFLWSGYMCYWL